MAGDGCHEPIGSTGSRMLVVLHLCSGSATRDVAGDGCHEPIGSTESRVLKVLQSNRGSERVVEREGMVETAKGLSSCRVRRIRRTEES